MSISILNFIYCCENNGYSCDSDSDCCSNYCRNFGCARICENRSLQKIDDQCKQGGDHCIQNEECCNGHCRISLENCLKNICE